MTVRGNADDHVSDQAADQIGGSARVCLKRGSHSVTGCPGS